VAATACRGPIGRGDAFHDVGRSGIEGVSVIPTGHATSRTRAVTLRYERDGVEYRSAGMVSHVRGSLQRKAGAPRPFAVWLAEAPANAELISIDARNRNGTVLGSYPLDDDVLTKQR
jgi:hypothetical protein